VIRWAAERAALLRHFLAGNGNSRNAREGLHSSSTSETPATSRGLRFQSRRMALHLVRTAILRSPAQMTAVWNAFQRGPSRWPRSTRRRKHDSGEIV